MAVIAVDFDDVIHDQSAREPGRRMGKPIPGAAEVLNAWKQAGHVIVVHTVDLSRDGSKLQAVSDWMVYFNLPFDQITSAKPAADIYLDDKAVRFTSWDQAAVDVAGFVS